jgi:pilus assembly protein CpaC
LKLHSLQRLLVGAAGLGLALTTPAFAQQATPQMPTPAAAPPVIIGKPGTIVQELAATGGANPRMLPVAATEEISVAIGEIRVLPVQGKIKRIALGNGACVSATTIDTSIMLIGEAPGTTSMMVWSDTQISSYRLRVRPAGAAESRQFLDKIIGDSNQQLSVQDFESRLVVSGRAPKATLDQLASLQKFMPNLVVNVVEDREQTRSVLFRLHFVEVNKSLLESLGVQWARDAQGPAIGGQGVAVRDGIYRNIPPAKDGSNLLDPNPPFVSVGGRTSGIFFGLATSIASRLKFGSSDGETRILASPELTAVSGGKARLQVGGEVPIPMAGAFGATTVEFKPYGIIFNIEPVIGPNDTIIAKVSTELSQIDPTLSVQGIPGFLTRMTSTEISVRPGEMVALSGLVNSELSNAIDKVPGLGSVPVLGRLFRSDDFRNKRTDLVVLLEPEIVVPGQGFAEQVRSRGVDNVKTFEAKVREAPAPSQPAPVRSTTPDPNTDRGGAR